MRRIRIRTSLSFLFALAISAAAAQSPDFMLHRPAPAFVRTDLSHRRIDLAEYRGRVVLLTFWATWCVPCRVEMPHLIAWQKRYAPRGLQIIAISMDDDPAPVRAFLRKHPVNYPVLMGDEQLGSLYGGVLGLPVTFLVDRQGNIAARFKGEGDLGAMKEHMRVLLDAP